MELKFRFDNMDASENAFFSRQLETIRAQAFEVRYAELKGKTLVPVKTDIHPGAEEYTYRVYDRVGRAAVSSDASDRGPDVEIKGTEKTQKIRTLKAHYKFSIQESRAAQMAQSDLDARKARAARDSIETLHDDIMLVGDAESGMKGLFTLSGTETYTVPNGQSGSTLLTTMTPDEIVQVLHAMVYQVNQNSSEIETCDTLVLPLARRGLIMSTRMGDGSNDTIYTHFMATNGHIKRIEWSQKLNAAPAGEWVGCRAVAYKNSPDKLECLMPVPFDQLPPQWDGYTVKTHCHARNGGIVLYFPKSVIYADNI